jgi:MFS family permease
MSQPWFDPLQFATHFGAFGGGIGGSLLGILGALTGTLAPRGRGKGVVVGLWMLAAGAGIACLATGLVAVADRQPYGIWYPLLLTGFVVGGLATTLLFAVVLPAYRAAEARKLAAEEIRQGPTGPVISPQ